MDLIETRNTDLVLEHLRLHVPGYKNNNVRRSLRNPRHNRAVLTPPVS